MSGRESRTASPTSVWSRRSRRRRRAAVVSSTCFRPSGKCSRWSTANDPCTAWQPSWVVPTSKSRRRCSAWRARVSSCSSIPATPSARMAARPAPSATPPSWSPGPSGRCKRRIWTQRAPPPSRREACSRTMRRFTFCWGGFTWPRDAARPRLRSCGVRCGWIRSSPPRSANWVTRWFRWAGSPSRSIAGISGSGSRAVRPKRRRYGPRSSGRGRRRGCSLMADDIRALSAQLAQDPQSLVFLRLGEALRRKGQLEAALRVAINGLERHPHLADAHDLYARILTDRREYERAFDEWDMAVRIAPNHTGALKGLAFLYFKVGDLAQAEAHLEAARKVEPDDPSIDQAIAMMRKGTAPPAPAPTAATTESSSADSPTAASSTAQAAQGSGFDEARVFAGLEGANEGLLLIDGVGRVLGGRLREGAGTDVPETVAAYLAGGWREA